MSALNSLLIHDHHLGAVREATADEIIIAARACVANRMRRGASLTSPKAARDYLVLRFAELQHEVFCVIYLDSRHRVIECQDLFRGTIDGASVHPREVVKEALKRGAAACMLAHSVAGHRMIVMCPVSICGLRRLEAITAPILLSGGPHNGRLQRRRRVHGRQGRMVIAGPGRSDAAGAGGLLRGCLASSVATDRRSKVLSGLSWRVHRSLTPPASCAS